MTEISFTFETPFTMKRYSAFKGYIFLIKLEINFAENFLKFSDSIIIFICIAL